MSCIEVTEEQGILIDLQTGKRYFLPALNVSEGSMLPSLKAGGKIEAVRIVTDGTSIDLSQPDVRDKIFSRIGMTGSLYAGIGLSLSSMDDNNFSSVKLVGIGIGTPGIGISAESASIPEKTVTEKATDKGVEIVKQYNTNPMEVPYD